MKRLIITIGIFLAVVFVLALTTYQGSIGTDCCLCSASQYHAPCLVDLETGELLELSLYAPHATISGELAKEQPAVDTFSFVRLGDLIGTKQTDARIIEIKIPVQDIIQTLDFCGNCQKQLQYGFEDRYVLADLYDVDSITIIPIAGGVERVIRCYSISMAMSEEGKYINLVIQGLLE